MKTTGTPCKLCKYGGKQGYEQPCCWCISNEDIALSVHNPSHPIDFVYFEPQEVPERK